MSELREEHVDPPVEERKYHRHTTTGDRGYEVWRDGRRMIKLDRANDDIVRAYSQHEWVPDRETRPLTIAAKGQIQFECDLSFRYSTGLRHAKPLVWNDLTDKGKRMWWEKGPGKGPRAALWKAIDSVLAPLTQ